MALDPVKNFATCEVSTGYDAAATSIVLSGGEGAKLPAPATDGQFNLVWWNFTDYSNPENDANVEIVRCTARSTDTLTVTRAQESTGASTKNTGGKTYYMRLCPTAKLRDDLVVQALGCSGVASELTISSGAVTITKSNHSIDTESDAATDDLATISGGIAGQVLILKPAHTDRTVVVKHASDNIRLYGGVDYWLSDTRDVLALQYNGSLWNEVSRSSFKGWFTFGAGQSLSVSSNTITPECSRVIVNTGSAAQTVNTITAMPAGTVLCISTSSGTYTATFYDAADNLYLGGDRALTSTTDRLILESNGASWVELAFANNG